MKKIYLKVIRGLNPIYEKEIKMITEIKLDHEFLANNETILNLIFARLRYTSKWQDIRERLGDESAAEFLVELIHDDQLPTVHFKTTLQDDSFTHAFGTKKAWSTIYKPDSLYLEICGTFIPSEVLKREFTHTQYDALESLVEKKINQWDGPNE